ncbi:MAG TPA: carboxypeptidase regulatory-like domain-containing protein [Fimbriimonadaceae bacterium]|nr:carboxypeptidase regulatory-like domain-containing protein [Fimbriimonadaceae bacterium]HRJ95292.1 carboxypeptidase regulatory-like domain-containing protein [Fimbriimonadaceae bacterium]
MLLATLTGILLSQDSTVEGTVVLSKKPAANAVVTLEGNERAKPISGAKLSQKGKVFRPHVLVVTVGSKVEFPNDDTIYHNVFAHFKAKKFDLGMYPRGSSKSVTFDNPGLVSILCNVHPEMSAYIMVVDTPYYATTDRTGKFRIANVKPGEYTVKVWHESGRTRENRLQASGNKIIDIDLGAK